MIQVIRTADHPEAGGKIAQLNDVQYVLSFPHENGDDYIELRIGRRGYVNFQSMLREAEWDDACDIDPAFWI